VCGRERERVAGSQAERISARERQEREDRRQRRSVFAGVGVLVFAAAVVVVGLFVTQYLPPRARVATIEGDSVSASGLVDRALLIAIAEQELQPPAFLDLPVFTLERLIDEAALRSASAELGSPTEEQRAAEGRALLQLPDDADAVAFAESLTDTLRRSGLSRDEFDAIVEARVHEAAVRADIEVELGESAVQLRLRRIRVADEARAQELRDQALAGADFGGLADEASLDATAEPGGDLGWLLAEQIDLTIASAIAGLEVGDITEPLPVGFLFVLYLLEDRDDARPLEEQQIAELVDARMEEWLAAARGSVDFERDLSANESEWVAERFRGRFIDDIDDRQHR
jgi:parvulin-like peptidyl-prolyl isomerase